ncbi:MAG: diguanylate cyclase [Gammaproteobacteria bacterium]|nr:diguanylate cyclase [Gammaproteobacteria bacterium]
MAQEGTVFIVDDDTAVRESLCLFLEHEGLNVEAYASAADFLKSAQAWKSGCLLLDVSMPGMNGLQLQQVLAERDFHIPIIFITGHGDVPMSVKALRAGAFNFVEKPFDSEQLLNSIKEAMEGVQQIRPGETEGQQAPRTNDAESVMETLRFPFLVLEDDLRVSSTNRALFEVFNIPTGGDELAAAEGFAQYLWKTPLLRKRVERVFTNNVELRNIEISIDYPRTGRITLLIDVRQVQPRIQPGKQAQRPRALLVMEDITQRKRIEETLFMEKERAQITLDSIKDAVITTDARGEVLYLNPIAEQLVGWSAAEACGQRIDKVLTIVDEDTEEAIDNPVYLSLQQAQSVILQEPALLLARNGQRIAIDSTASPVNDRNGKVMGVVLMLKDVTTQRQLTTELVHAASHDSLTGLVNRHEFEKRLQHAIESSKKHGLHHTLCFIDLDKFKTVNDTAGHAAGDALLQQVAALFQTRLRDRDTLARLGGDEFGLLFENCQLSKAAEITETMVEEISAHKFSWGGHSFTIGASVGLVSITSEAKSPSDLLGQADVACYGAKRRGRSCVHIHHAQDKSGHGTLHR